MEGLMYLHHPQILKSIQIIKNGEIGKIKNIPAIIFGKIVSLTPGATNK